MWSFTQQVNSISYFHFSLLLTWNRPFSCGNHTCQLECHPIEHHDSTCPTDIHKITTCPCGKMEVNNRQTCTDEIPLCDSICNKRIDGCEHRCMQTCHKGPCPPCTQVATMQCKCGREKGTVLCSEKHSGYQCDRPCKQMLDCGRHKCFALCCSLDRHQRICPETCGKVSDCGVHTCQVRCHKGACLPCPGKIKNAMEECI